MKPTKNRRLLSPPCLVALGCILLLTGACAEGHPETISERIEHIVEAHTPPPEPPQEDPPPIAQQEADTALPPAEETAVVEPTRETAVATHGGMEIEADWVEGYTLASGRPGGMVNLFIPIRFLLSGEACDTNTDEEGLFQSPGEDTERYTQAPGGFIDWATLTLLTRADTPDTPFGPMPDFRDTATLMDEGRNHGYAAFYNIPIAEEIRPGTYHLSFLLRYQARGEAVPREVRLVAPLAISTHDVVEGILDVVSVEEQARRILDTPEPPEAILTPTPEPTPGPTEDVPPEAGALTHQEVLSVMLDESLYMAVAPGDMVVLPLAISLEGQDGLWQSNQDERGGMVPYGAPSVAFRQDIPGEIASLSVELNAGQLTSPDFPFEDGGGANTVATVITDGVNQGYAVFEGLIARPGVPPEDKPLHFTIRWSTAENAPSASSGRGVLQLAARAEALP